MSPKQTAWYWREWSAVVRAAQAAGKPKPTDADRHEFHRRALGQPKSSKELTNTDLDKVIAEFRAHSRDADLNAQTRQQRQHRDRCLWVIRQRLIPALAEALDAPADATPEARRDRARAYAAAIIHQKFSSPTIEDLTDAQLRLLMVDLTRAAGAKVKSRKQKAESTADCPF